MANQTNIEEVIQQLEHSPPHIKEQHTTKTVVEPSKQLKVQNITQMKVVPFIMKVEKHVTKAIEAQKTETIVENFEIIEYVPYIQYKNGDILPYEKKILLTVILYQKKIILTLITLIIK